MTAAGGNVRGTAVSLTPVALDRDSRAFRTARVLREMGFRSILIEGRASTRRFWEEGLDVRSLAEGGVERASETVRRGHTRDLVTALRKGRGGALGEWALYLGFRGDDWWHFCHRARCEIPAADLYYLHSFELYRATAPLASRCGARIVYDAHDYYRGIEPIASQHPFDRKRMRPFLDRLEDRVLAEADAVVTVSDGVAGLIERAGGRRPAVIRNCHDERDDRAPAADLRTRLGLTPDDRLCVVVGNYKQGMAVAVALEAFACLPDRFHLAFVGLGYDRADLPPVAAPLRQRVHFGQFAVPNEIVPSIRSADIGLVIYEACSDNYRYALPNGFFQAAAAGLPLVRAPLPEIEAVIGGRPVGTCLSQLDAGELARAVLDCADRAKILKPAVAELAAALRWQDEAARLRHLIDAALARRQVPGGCQTECAG
jgi:glycosyltransferase involved in cell wall biosynthesis